MTDAPQLPLDEAGPADRRSLEARAADTEADLAWTLYAEMATRCGLPVPSEKSPARLKAIRRRLADHGGIARWRHALGAVEASRELRGGGSRGWKAHLDWFLVPSRFVQCLERVFDQDFGKPAPPSPGKGSKSASPRDPLDVYRDATSHEREVQFRLFSVSTATITDRQAGWHRHQDERRASGHRARWKMMPPKGWTKPDAA